MTLTPLGKTCLWKKCAQPLMCKGKFCGKSKRQKEGTQGTTPTKTLFLLNQNSNSSSVCLQSSSYDFLDTSKSPSKPVIRLYNDSSSFWTIYFWKICNAILCRRNFCRFINCSKLFLACIFTWSFRCCKKFSKRRTMIVDTALWSLSHALSNALWIMFLTFVKQNLWRIIKFTPFN